MDEFPDTPRISHARASYTSALVSRTQEEPLPRPHRRLFLTGLLLGMVPVLLALAVAGGGLPFFRSWELTSLLVLYVLPLCTASVGVACTAVKATRWFGVGFIIGFLLYVLCWGILLELLVGEF